MEFYNIQADLSKPHVMQGHNSMRATSLWLPAILLQEQFVRATRWWGNYRVFSDVNRKGTLWDSKSAHMEVAVPCAPRAPDLSVEQGGKSLM